MIGFIQGILLAKSPPTLILDVQGIGYEVEAPMTTFYNLPDLGEQVKLHTHLVVREDAHILYGFSAETDKMLFRALIKVNGVGPKMALTILSGLSADAFHLCINDNDTQALVRLPGVGKKTAERLIIEMRDRLPDLPSNSTLTGTNESNTVNFAKNSKQEAVSALITLGYKPLDANKMLQNIPDTARSCEEMIKFALQQAGKR